MVSVAKMVESFYVVISFSYHSLQTDEQAPLPDALQQLLQRVQSGLKTDAGDFIFNCQMGRGRTTTGMVTACLIATTSKWEKCEDHAPTPEDMENAEIYDSMDGYSEEEAYLQGMCFAYAVLA